jgi:Fic family protein
MLKPRFTISNLMTAVLTQIERARGFLEAAKLSEDWVEKMRSRALLLEAHYTTHIEGTRLTLEQAEHILSGMRVPEADPDDVRELLNYRAAFEFVSEYLETGLPAPRPNPGEFCVYVLKCADDSFYIGQTDDFPRRYEDHCSKRVSWTAPRLPAEPIHWEVFDSREKAMKRERELKTGFGRKWLKREYVAGRLAGASRQAGGAITEGLIREIHKRLVEGVRGGVGAPGQYRTVQNYVVNSRTRAVLYTPPPPSDVPALMRDLVAWLNGVRDIHAVLVSGIAQFELVHIHPFVDGNGRTSRLLSTLCLYRAGYDFKRLFTISEYYDRDRTAFYDALQHVREQGMDLTGWLEYFVDGLATQMKEVTDRGKRIIRRDAIAQKYGLTARQALAVGYLLENPVLRIEDYEKLCPGTNKRTLQRDLKTLFQKGLLKAEGSARAIRYRLKIKGL